ncbi:MAG: RtcB family protein, partial [Candidatus Sumerlaeota bacterium]|nr:RtcB family protein [Candidatus Sumerlaeota bacterium]
MKKRQLLNIGIPPGPAMRAAQEACGEASRAGWEKDKIRERLDEALADPQAHLQDEFFGALAKQLAELRAFNRPVEFSGGSGEGGGSGDSGSGGASESCVPLDKPVPCKIYGSGFEKEALQQIENACSLPISVRGALMPDGHVGYGLPIGGVLATRNAVIPYAVGVDIACRMKMTVLDLPVSALGGQTDRLRNALLNETRFGVGASFRERRHHNVMDEDWSFSPVVKRLKDKAWSQLGTSGSGNHFAEYGVLTVLRDGLALPPGEYLALLSHSGSRGAGNEIARHYSQLAMKLRRNLPKHLAHLAWLNLDSDAGREYWEAMQLMGRYASANHELIHRYIARTLRADVMLDIENHHNFAWEEIHDGQRVIVHRKGATPAARGMIGIIPGSMATPGYVVRGKGVPESMNSAAHGAGRRMSRTAAKSQFTGSMLRKHLEERGITLLSADVDEAPMAYKDIEEVMAAQSSLVEILARFDPKMVKMAPPGERAEDSREGGGWALAWDWRGT